MTGDTSLAALKPCPFCGESQAMLCDSPCGWNDSGKAWAVSCRTEDCHGAIFSLGYDLFETQAEAIAAWNTRATEPAPTQGNAKLLIRCMGGKFCHHQPGTCTATRDAAPAQAGDADLVERVAEILWKPTADYGETWAKTHSRTKLTYRHRAREVVTIVRAQGRAEAKREIVSGK